MLITLLKEVYYLAKFKSAIKNTNLGDASKFLYLHKEASNAIKVNLKTTMSESRSEMAKQKELMDNLIKSI